MTNYSRLKQVLVVFIIYRNAVPHKFLCFRRRICRYRYFTHCVIAIVLDVSYLFNITYITIRIISDFEFFTIHEPFIFNTCVCLNVSSIKHIEMHFWLRQLRSKVLVFVTFIFEVMQSILCGNNQRIAYALDVLYFSNFKT